MKEIDYEEMLLEVSDIMRAHNRVRPDMTHREAAIAMRKVVTPSGKWVAAGDKEDPYALCPFCEEKGEFYWCFCPYCGANLFEDMDIELAIRGIRRRLGEES